MISFMQRTRCGENEAVVFVTSEPRGSSWVGGCDWKGSQGFHNPASSLLRNVFEWILLCGEIMVEFILIFVYISQNIKFK